MGHLTSRPVKRCAFCKNKADSKEHPWSDWVLKRFRGPRDQIIGRFGDQTYFDPRQKSLRVRCVCGDCNPGWMKQLEDTVIPTAGLLMHDLTIPLDIPQQWAIAQWIILKAMVFEYVSNVSEPIFYSDDERVALRTLRAIPPQTAIWLARYSGSETLHAKATRFGADKGALTVDGYLTTQTYRHLAVQIMTIRTDQPEDGAAIVHRKPGPWSDTILRIWPTDRRIEWPPRLNVAHDESSLIDFHESFKGIQKQG